MTYSDICQSVAKLRAKFDETDPFRLCRAMGITILLQPMGSHDTAIKGFFMECKRIKTITVNITLHQREYFKQQTEAKNVKYNQRDGPFL